MGGLHLPEWAPVALAFALLAALLAVGHAGLRRPRRAPSDPCLSLLADLHRREVTGGRLCDLDIPDDVPGREAWRGGFVTTTGHPAADDITLTDRALRALHDAGRL